MQGIHVRIQHHPSRADLIPGLLARLEPLPVEVVEHESVPPSPWAGYRQCLEDIPNVNHLLIVQDDAQPCHNFVPALEQIAEANPDAPVCLFLSKLPRDASAQAARAMKQGRRYVSISWRTFLPIVAVLWPVEKAVEFREWADATPKLPGIRGDVRSDDAVAGRWKMVTRQTVRACVPSIVEHPDEVASTIKPGQENGRTAAFMAENALDYDWSHP